MEHWGIQSLSDQLEACLAAIWASLCCYLIMELSKRGSHFMGMCSFKILNACTPALHYINIKIKIHLIWRWFIWKCSCFGGGGGVGQHFSLCFLQILLALLILQRSCNEWMDECGLELKRPYSLELSQLSAAIVIPCTFWIDLDGWFHLHNWSLGGGGLA